MNKIALALAVVMSFGVYAEEIPAELAPMVKMITDVTDWTVPELKAGLDRLDRLYQNDMATDEGRRRWHGAITNVVIDTNALHKVQVYADGHCHTQRFQRVEAMGLVERLTAAEAKAKREEAEAKRKEAEAKRKAERIATLENDLAGETAKLMRSRDWPEELARLYLLNELSKLKGTNVVGGVVTPQGAR